MTDTKITYHMPHNDNSLSADVIINTKTADSSGKIIFEDPVLCSQFLRDYIDIPCMKDVQPEDIEDVSEQYVPLFSEERNADRVKKVNIKDEPPFFLISLIEHKSKVDYNVTMQIFRYMIHIWDRFTREAERIQKGITKLKDFKYPPILPIVYYEGSSRWTVPANFKSRIMNGDIFGKYIPDFEYYLVPLHDYSNEELLENNDEMSLVMMINKMQNIGDIEAFKKLPAQKVEAILEDASEHVLDIISKVLRTFLLKMNLPEDETEELVGKVKEKKMGYLFENMEKIDIQAERRKVAEQRRLADQEKQRADQEKQRADQEKQRAEQEKRRADQEKQRADQEKQRAGEAEENLYRTLIETYQELGFSKEDTLQELQDKCNISLELAKSKFSLYWK